MTRDGRIKNGYTRWGLHIAHMGWRLRWADGCVFCRSMMRCIFTLLCDGQNGMFSFDLCLVYCSLNCQVLLIPASQAT